MKFGEVIEGLREGRCYRRSGWNGKGMFVCKQIPASVEGFDIAKLKSLPQKAKDLLLQKDGDYPVLNYTNQMLIVNPSGRADSWVPSSSDVFAEDWEEVE